MKDVSTQDTPVIVVPPSDMHRHFGELLSSKEGADVKFRVRKKTFSAHRSVLAARSPVFKKALLGPMKEGTTTSAIPIDDMEADVFEALLTFMYTDDLPDTIKEQEESARLKLICEDKLCKHIDSGSAATILALAEQHNCHGLKEACLDFLSTSTALKQVMETDGFEYLTKNCPSILKELLSKGASVRFDVTVLKDVQTVETPFLVVPPSDMHKHFGDLLSSKEGADVKFRVGKKTFSAHRLVLSTRSRVFKAELYGKMKESATSNIIHINDMEAEVFDALLTFMYTDSLPEMMEQEESAMAQHLLVAADRYNLERLKLISDRYNLEGLKLICEDKLCGYIDEGTVGSILELADQHHCHGLKKACLSFLMDTEGFNHLSKSCPSVVKELIAVLGSRHLN
ncbi:hypothetical protein HU200_021967 [Digitaria exilis]|uniref:BTB domain-containing protein n=1 Tax=Digitaria exilis TaxID=1010633 RepID=A0A835C7S8_9POAL|nr:hypothetical protein HU200_021967 [Digitaria exilis]